VSVGRATGAPSPIAPPPPVGGPEDDEEDVPPPLEEPRPAPPPARSTGAQPSLGAGPPLPAPRQTMPPPMRAPMPGPAPATTPPVGPAPSSARETGSRSSLPEPLPPRDPSGPIGGPPAAPRPTRPLDGGAPRLVGAGAAAPATVPSPGPAPAAVAPTVPSMAPQPAPVAPPPPDPKRQRHLELQREIREKLAAQLEIARMPIERLAEESLWQRAESVIVDMVEQLDADGHIPQFVDQDALIKDTLNETLGLGPLEDLLADEAVTEILVNRHDRVLFEKAGRLEHTDKIFSSEAALRDVVDRLVAPTGRRVDAHNHCFDLRLPDGSRLTAALPPLAPRGAALTLRKPRTGAVSMDDLVRAGCLSKPIADFLGVCVAARKNVIVCGGPSSGKGFMLAALANLAAPGERLVSVEDVAELPIGRDHWIALETRAPDVSLQDILRLGLHMRPDRLIVGDVGGAATYDLIVAMAGAQDGTLVSIGAEGARAALACLETHAHVVTGGAGARGVRDLLAASAHVIVHVARYADGAQRVASVTEVGGTRGGDDYELRELFQFQPQGRGPDGVIRGRHAGLGVIPRFYESLEARGISADPAIFK
jgi:pilus assembly protein CpaF